VNTLSLVPGHRTGSGTQREVDFDDFAIDGAPLRGGDATRLEATQPEAAVDSLRKLLGLEEPDFPDGRVALYVCGECGDYGCGATTVRIASGTDVVVWDQFGWQTDYDPVVVPTDAQRSSPSDAASTSGPSVTRWTGTADFFVGDRQQPVSLRTQGRERIARTTAPA
jgi:hypothetical protein